MLGLSIVGSSYLDNNPTEECLSERAMSESIINKRGFGMYETRHVNTHCDEPCDFPVSSSPPSGVDPHFTHHGSPQNLKTKSQDSC